MNYDQKKFTPTTHIGDKGNECRSTIYDKPKNVIQQIEEDQVILKQIINMIEENGFDLEHIEIAYYKYRKNNEEYNEQK